MRHFRHGKPLCFVTLASAVRFAGKAECKAALQRELGLPVDASIPLIGFIGRLDHQKVWPP